MKKYLALIFLLSSIFFLSSFINPSAAFAQSNILYISNANNNDTVTAVNPITNTIEATIPVGNVPEGEVTNGNYIYVANINGASISVIDTATNNVVATIPVSGTYPNMLALSPDGTRLYAGDTSPSGVVTVINTATNTVITTLTGFAEAQGLAVSPDGSKLYVVNTNGSNSNGWITVVDTSDYSTIATINVGAVPVAIALTPDGTKAYVTNNGGTDEANTVSVIDTLTNSVINTISVGINPFGIAMNSAGTFVYVANSNYWNGGNTNSVLGSVSVINTATDTVTATIPVGYVPSFVAVSPDNSTVYITNSNSGTVSVINASSNTVENTLNAGTNPYGIAFGPVATSPITVNSFSGGTINQGGTYTSTGSFTDPNSTAASWSATVNYGDGSGTQPLTLIGNDFTLIHQYNDSGNYTVTVNVTDNLGATGSGTATVIVNPLPMTPSQDSFIEHNGQNANEGTSPFLELSIEGKDRALIQFNESQIQAAVGNLQNYTATLQLTIVSNNNKWTATGRQIDVDRMLQAWTEGNGSVAYNGYRGAGAGVTWNCATDSNIANDTNNCSGSTAWDMIDPDSWPFVSTPTATSIIKDDQSGTVSFNVTADVESFVNGSNTNNGWVVRKDDETQDGDVQFGSRESFNSPKLIITPN